MRALLPLLLLSLPAAPPADEPPPAPAPAAPTRADGEALLAEVISALEDGDFDAALQKAVPAIATWPELAPSFRAAAELAMDQLHRQAPAPIIVQTPATAATGRPGRQPWEPGEPEWKVGFDAGTMTGLRVEWDRGGRIIDSVGFRTGGGLFIYSSLLFAGHAVMYVDWRLNENLRLETPLGLLFYGGSPYPLVQIGLQIERPDSPMHINIGIGGFYSAIQPDLGVGFLW